MKTKKPSTVPAIATRANATRPTSVSRRNSDQTSHTSENCSALGAGRAAHAIACVCVSEFVAIAENRQPTSSLPCR